MPDEGLKTLSTEPFIVALTLEYSKANVVLINLQFSNTTHK